MLEQLMKIYAASQGLNDSLADEAAFSSEENGSIPSNSGDPYALSQK